MRCARLAGVVATAAAAGLAGGWVALAGPAGAAPPPTSGPPLVTITQPKSNFVETKTSTVTIAGNVTPPAPNGQITGVQITITPKGGQPNPTSFSTTAQRPSSGQQQDPWTFSAPVNLAYNGPYSVTAIATESDPNAQPHQGQQSDPVNFAVGVAPQVPTGVTAAKDSNGSAVTLSWQANPEPDVVYQVQRAAVNGSNWSTVSPGSGVSDTNFHDTGVQSGTDYQYRVIAVRPGAQQGQTISSAPSATASTTARPGGPLFGPGGSVPVLPQAIQAITDPVAGQVHPGQGPGGPVTGSPTAGGYGNLPYNGGQASLSEPGTPGAQDPKGRSASANLVRTALFVAGALILLAIAAHLIRMRRALDDRLEPVGVDSWDRHAAGAAETAEVATVGTGRSDPTRSTGALRGADDRSAVTRAMTAQRRR